jgi:curli production assembly/transport component CsgE
MLRTTVILVAAALPAWAAAGDGESASPVPAAQGAGAAAAFATVNFLEDQFGGSVTKDTVSVAGDEFYRKFCAFWHDKPQSERFAVAVREQPSARRGNQVVVEFAGHTVFQGALPARNGNLAALSEAAVEIAYAAVVNADVNRLLFREKDLGLDEF